MKFKSFIILFAFCVTLGSQIFAQSNAYTITVKVDKFKGDVCYLGYPYGDKKYLADTAQINEQGEFVFDGSEPLDGGLYFVYSPAPASLYFDVVVAESEFSLTTDTLDVIASMKSQGSVENQIFFDFQRFMREKQNLGNSLSQKVKSTPDGPEKEALQAQLKSLDAEVKNYRSSLIAKHPNAFAAKFIRSTITVEVPEAPKDDQGKPIDPNFAFNYYKQHYFDYIDFSDKKMLRTPNFYSKIIDYLEKMTVKHPDSIISSLHVIIEKARANDEVFRYCVQNLTHKYETSNIMGMDAVFVDLAEHYYMSGDAFWADSATIAKITDRVLRIKPNLIGNDAPRMFLLDTDMKPVDALKTNSEYTVLYFYDPDCGHCKKKTPVLRDLYHDKLKDLGVAVVAANIKKDMDKWKSYIEEQNLDWINVADPHMRSNFRYEYNIETTPQVYIIDAQKKIIAKKLDVEQIEDFIIKQKEIKQKSQRTSG